MQVPLATKPYSSTEGIPVIGMASPNMGDVGILEESEIFEIDTSREANDNILRNIHLEKSTMSLRSNELQRLIRESQI